MVCPHNHRGAGKTGWPQSSCHHLRQHYRFAVLFSLSKMPKRGYAFSFGSGPSPHRRTCLCNSLASSTAFSNPCRSLFVLCHLRRFLPWHNHAAQIASNSASFHTPLGQFPSRLSLRTGNHHYLLRIGFTREGYLRTAPR